MRVFVYGTLVEPATVREVLDSFVFVGPATLHGLHAVSGTYPTLAPGGEVAGRLLRTDDIDALDEYERVADGLYVRVALPLRPPEDDATGSEDAAGTNGTAGTGSEDAASTVSPTDSDETEDTASPTDSEDTVESVAVYVGDPERLDAPADWPGDGSFPARVRAYLDTHPVFVRRR